MVLGLVPQIRVPRSKPREALVEPSDSRHAYVESFRHLRSALLLSPLSESRPQTLLLTGVAPGEGKTTIAVNLARTLARSGLRVTLVDTDIHGGKMHRLLGQEDRPGLLDYLRGETQTIIYPTDVEGLSVVPIGTDGGEADGLFLRPEFTALMLELKRDQDFVILDGAPIVAADDAALLVPHADAVVVVVRPFYSRSRSVRRALEMLYQRQAKHVAMILNRAQADDLAGRYYGRNGATGAAKSGRGRQAV
jgi:capsular exopolysaccharide synthesis family protein